MISGKARCLLVFLALACIPLPAQGDSIGLYSTGDFSGAFDLHYIISTVAPSLSGACSQEPCSLPVQGTPYLTNQPVYVDVSPVTPNGPLSSWVTSTVPFETPPFADTNLYTYKTTFDLTGLDPSSAQIAGSWAVDDMGWMYLNGQLVAELPYYWVFLQLYGLQVTGNGYTANHDFLLTSGFLPGLNTLEFLVSNDGGGHTALRVEIASATANPVPEPSTMLLLGSGLAGLVGYGRRRMKK